MALVRQWEDEHVWPRHEPFWPGLLRARRMTRYIFFEKRRMTRLFAAGFFRGKSTNELLDGYAEDYISARHPSELEKQLNLHSVQTTRFFPIL
jgi:hypothetical protein